MQSVWLPTFRERRARARSMGIQAGNDLVLVAPSADLFYLVGTGEHASERPTLLVFARDTTVLLIPELEAAKLDGLEDVTVLAYGETDDPLELLAPVFQDQKGDVHALISDRAWAAVLLRLQTRFPQVTFGPASSLLRDLRLRKTSEEIDVLREAGRRADMAFEQMVQRRFTGRTEREIGAELAALLLDQGLASAGWGPIVGSGPNGASPHHTAGDRRIHEGDAVVMDFGGTLDGYQADITRTVHAGTPDDEFRQVYAVVRQAQEAGVDAVRPGTQAQAIDSAARRVIDAAGFGAFFIHRTGHGIGLDEHEEPYIVRGNDLPVEPGMTFSVEPGVYLPGRFGVRIEDIVAVTDGGCERLNAASRELIVVH